MTGWPEALQFAAVQNFNYNLECFVDFAGDFQIQLSIFQMAAYS